MSSKKTLYLYSKSVSPNPSITYTECCFRFKGDIIYCYFRPHERERRWKLDGSGPLARPVIASRNALYVNYTIKMEATSELKASRSDRTENLECTSDDILRYIFEKFGARFHELKIVNRFYNYSPDIPQDDFEFDDERAAALAAIYHEVERQSRCVDIISIGDNQIELRSWPRSGGFPVREIYNILTPISDKAFAALF